LNPRTPTGQGPKPNKKVSTISLSDASNLLEDFKKFCLIDLRLNELTANDYVYHVKRFLEFTKGSITQETVREYLLKFRYMSPKTYKNVLCALKRFIRDYMRMHWVVESFKFPKQSYVPKRLPTKEELVKFYNALPSLQLKTLFLLLASSGLRLHEALELSVNDIDMKRRMIIPKSKDNNPVKKTWVTFFNEECLELLTQYINTYKPDNKLFPIPRRTVQNTFTSLSRKLKTRITAQILREWFCQTMGELGVPDRFIDAFCGRTPKSVLARHYSDYSPDRLKKIYDSANLRIIQ